MDELFARGREDGCGHSANLGLGSLLQQGVSLKRDSRHAWPWMKLFSPDDLIACYKRGVFPMAESREDEGFFIVDPEWRCVLPLDGFHVPKRLKRTVRGDAFSFTIDRNFIAVIDACAAPAPEREDTWINSDIRALYIDLNARGLAHSVET